MTTLIADLLYFWTGETSMKSLRNISCDSCGPDLIFYFKLFHTRLLKHSRSREFHYDLMGNGVNPYIYCLQRFMFSQNLRVWHIVPIMLSKNWKYLKELFVEQHKMIISYYLECGCSTDDIAFLTVDLKKTRNLTIPLWSQGNCNACCFLKHFMGWD